jgi:hypothetical protein
VLPDQLQKPPKELFKKMRVPFQFNLGGQHAFALVATRSATGTRRSVVDAARRLKRSWEIKLAWSGRPAGISVLRLHSRTSP